MPQCLLLTQSGHLKAYRSAAARFALQFTMADKSTQLARQIPAGVWALGIVSLLMDVSSESRYKCCAKKTGTRDPLRNEARVKLLW
jgi:hypothetical protein